MRKDVAVGSSVREQAVTEGGATKDPHLVNELQTQSLDQLVSQEINVASLNQQRFNPRRSSRPFREFHSVVVRALSFGCKILVLGLDAGDEPGRDVSEGSSLSRFDNAKREREKRYAYLCVLRAIKRVANDDRQRITISDFHLAKFFGEKHKRSLAKIALQRVVDCALRDLVYSECQVTSDAAHHYFSSTNLIVILQDGSSAGSRSVVKNFLPIDLFCHLRSCSKIIID